ncbi:uncharacterized protein A4U43_C05F11380 [Asparagus officinalis]|uniref:Inhibitor I9 domain-containing protein n=1 Tax=Asparagus officinalis TaxID=4686 RepID=A0A5P1ER61_ASPOF|nr:uncharacterized protein A4U43_C05F11380 [Asparagus officinalis]
MLKTPHHIFPHLSFFLLFIFTRTCNSHQQIYIVYLGGHNDTKALHEIHEHHHSLLHYVKNSEEEARESLLYSYKHIINGFAAFLSEDEATKISEMEEVISAFPSQKIYSLHTTRSWEFIETAEGPRNTLWENLMPKKAKYGKDVIVGMLDSGIWPESKSFDDKGMGPIPKRWKGICEEGDSFNSSSCNNKLIGARYYLKAYEAIHGPVQAATCLLRRSRCVTATATGTRTTCSTHPPHFPRVSSLRLSAAGRHWPSVAGPGPLPP